MRRPSTPIAPTPKGRAGATTTTTRAGAPAQLPPPRPPPRPSGQARPTYSRHPGLALWHPAVPVFPQRILLMASPRGAAAAARNNSAARAPPRGVPAIKTRQTTRAWMRRWRGGSRRAPTRCGTPTRSSRPSSALRKSPPAEAGLCTRAPTTTRELRPGVREAVWSNMCACLTCLPPTTTRRTSSSTTTPRMAPRHSRAARPIHLRHSRTSSAWSGTARLGART
mmetsp:Transcript_7188/g.19538  ORF Transcript_7188/g.19538 Transcript_7188/m.19538 type:complete len:224 (-) Transcript_7188:976-1647(-)